MTEDEINLWRRYRQGDQVAHEQLILSNLKLVKGVVNRACRVASWANRQDLMQDGVIGLMKALEQYDSDRCPEFEHYARIIIREAIFKSSELTRDLARRQAQNYRKIRQATNELLEMLNRKPTFEDIADRAGLTVEEVLNAIDAMSIAFAGGYPETADAPSAVKSDEIERHDRAILIHSALARLGGREAVILIYYYLQEQSHDEIAASLGLKESNVVKIRQRALGKLRKLLEVRKGGVDDDARRPGK